MEIFHLDDSGDARYGVRLTQHIALCAVSVPDHAWNSVFDAVKQWRASLSNRYGILTRKELHAQEFVAGKGRLGPRIVPRGLRVAIYYEGLQLLASFSSMGISIIGVCIPKQPGDDGYEIALDRMLNRIQRSLEPPKDQYGLLVFDEGKELQIRRSMRKMRVFNPVPSQFGEWSSGAYTKNIPTDRILGDPFFRKSSDYLIQLADFAAFALLKYREAPTLRVLRYGLHQAYPILDPVSNKAATKYDPLGIVAR